MGSPELMGESKAPHSKESAENARLCARDRRKRPRPGQGRAPSAAVSAGETKPFHRLLKRNQGARCGCESLSPALPARQTKKKAPPILRFLRRASENAACAPSRGPPGNRAFQALSSRTFALFPGARAPPGRRLVKHRQSRWPSAVRGWRLERCSAPSWFALLLETCLGCTA